MTSTTKERLKTAGEIEPAKAIRLSALVEVQAGAIVSRTLVQKTTGSMTLFAFDAGQALSEHTAPFDAYAQILEGTLTVTIAGTPVVARVGDLVLMPANIPHAVDATARSKMLLVMIRG